MALTVVVGDVTLGTEAGTTFMTNDFDVVVERDAEGCYVVSVPALHSCHTQARSLDELVVRIREAIELHLEVEGPPEEKLDFVGVQRVEILHFVDGSPDELKAVLQAAVVALLYIVVSVRGSPGSLVYLPYTSYNW